VGGDRGQARERLRELELHEIARRASEATICLVSALSRHDHRPSDELLQIYTP
jgi:hypothetical protein